MDRALVLNKIESLRRCIQRVEARCPEDVNTLLEDWDTQDILTMNLTRAVQPCVDIAAHVVSESDQPPPKTMGETLLALHRVGVLSAGLADRLRGAVGFRNVAIHNYRALDWHIVYAICHEHLGDFRAFARAVLQTLPPANDDFSGP